MSAAMSAITNAFERFEDTRVLKNTDILDETRNQATREIERIPGTGGDCYMKKSSNLYRGEDYLVVYDKYGKIIGRMTMRNGVVIDVESDRSDIKAILQKYLHAHVVTVRNNRADYTPWCRCCDRNMPLCRYCEDPEA